MLLMALPMSLSAQDNANSKLARQLFDHTYAMVFGPQGCSLSYKVNIIGLYKTSGTIWYKGKKSKFVESRYRAWNDGTIFTRVDQKKKLVEVFRADSPDRDTYDSKFKFEPDNYTYAVETTDTEYILTLNVKPGVDGVKHVKAVIDKKTRVPKTLKIKVLFFWAVINVENFKSGGIDDSLFRFPEAQYKDYKKVDKSK